MPKINIAAVAVQKTMQAVSLQIEIAASKQATTASKYASDNKTTLSGSGQWSHTSSFPAKAVQTAKEAIAKQIAREPNLMIVGPEVHRALVNNKDVIDRIKHTDGLTGTAGPMVNDAKLAQYFDIQNYVVGRARSGKAGAFTPVWGKFAVLAYSEVGSLASLGTPSFGYTYRLAGYPIVEASYFDKSCASWIYPVTTEDTPIIAGAGAGYLFSAAAA